MARQMINAHKRAFGLLLIKDKIQTMYARCASEESMLSAFKRANG